MNDSVDIVMSSLKLSKLKLFVYRERGKITTAIILEFFFVLIDLILFFTSVTSPGHTSNHNFCSLMVFYNIYCFGRAQSDCKTKYKNL